jgi:hypothetical protein
LQLNWDAIGALAELTGAVGVIVSLIYLAAQIRVNTKQMADHSRALRLAALESTASSFSRVRDPLMRDPACAALWNRASQDFEGLSADEKTQAGAMFQELYFSHQAVFTRSREGVYPELNWENQRKNIRAQMRPPGVQQWWRVARPLFNPEFVAEVESRTEDID